MVNPKLILSIIIGVAVIGITLLAFKWWVFGGILTALGLAFLYLWWRMNQLLEISQALMANDIPLARKRLEGIKNPEKLNAYSKTYYFFFQGMVETHANNLKVARQAFKTAIETNRFRAVDEKATAYVMLAQLDLRAQNKEGAKRYLREARALEPTDQVRDQIKMIVQQARLRL
jgi:hypothetical protein